MEHIESWLHQLEKSFGPPRSKICSHELKSLYLKKNILGLVKMVQKEMIPKPINLRVRKVSSGGPKGAPMWIKRRLNIPPFVTPQFQRHPFTLFIREQYVSEAPSEVFVASLAHEFSHIVLDSVRHQLRREEKCVDLCAMYFGYAELISIGYKERVVKIEACPGIYYRMRSFFTGKKYSMIVLKKAGYLSEEEVKYAFKRILEMRL